MTCNGTISASKLAVLDRLLGAGGGRNGEGILGLATEAIGLGAIFGEGAHQPTFVVGVFQAVEEHVVEHPAMAHPVTAAGPIEQVRRVGHAFHAAGHHHFGAAGDEHVMGEDRRFHARATHLVERGAAGRLVEAGTQRGLTRRCLAQAGGEHATEQHFFNRVGCDAGTLHGGLDGGGTQLRGAEAFQFALEAAHGCTDGADDDNRIVGHHESS